MDVGFAGLPGLPGLLGLSWTVDEPEKLRIVWPRSRSFGRAGTGAIGAVNRASSKRDVLKVQDVPAMGCGNSRYKGYQKGELRSLQMSGYIYKMNRYTYTSCSSRHLHRNPYF